MKPITHEEILEFEEAGVSFAYCNSEREKIEALKALVQMSREFDVILDEIEKKYEEYCRETFGDNPPCVN